MKLRKLCGSLAVTATMMLLGSPAQAEPLYFTCPVSPDQESVAVELERMAVAVRCKDNQTAEGSWDVLDPIWQWKRNGNGCEVHLKVSKLIDLERTEAPPPQKKGKNKAQGAANDIRDGKYGGGQASLQEFIDTLWYSAKTRPGHQQDEDNFMESADAAIACIDEL